MSESAVNTNNKIIKMATITESLQIASKHHRANDLTKAEQVYRQILEKQPNHPEALYGLGILSQQVGKFQNAEQLLNALLQIQPNSVKGWFSLGNLHQAQSQLPAAVEAYQQAIALQTDSAPLYNNLGYTLQLQGKWEEAVACYQKALELQPNCTEAEANLGNALHAQGKLSCQQQAQYAALNNQLGRSRQQAKDLKNAVACYRTAIALQPDFLDAYYNLGVALQEQGDLEEALVSYQKVLELNPDNGEIYLKLGKIYQDQKKLSEAISAYQQGLKLINPHYLKAFVADAGTEKAEEVPITPELPQEEVIVRNYKFPKIPAVAASEKKRPFWSVVIPAYKRTDYLLECLASVLAQWTGEEEMEILVMDNASTPPLFDLVNAIGRGIVSYYRNSQNIGLAGNHNTGIILSRGQWIHILHDDDYVLPGFYSQLKESLENCSDSVGAAFTGFDNINEKGVFLSKGDIFYWYGENRGIIQNWLLQIGVTNPLRPSAIVIRRQTYEKIGGYCSELSDLNGWELCKRIATFYDCWYEPKILACYRLDTSLYAQKMSNELFATGNHAVFLRRAIEITESYLPADLCTEITTNARSYNFEYLLENRVIFPLMSGNMTGALRILQEALKIDRSPEAVAKLFAWLTKDEAAPLRNEIAAKLLAIPQENIPDNIPIELKSPQTAIAP
ncbi:TPR repeat-containing protein [Nostoc sp. 'Lobaria pulmonaria (5183) cyanobiont']|nr:TPR repeat-containing protein [Nostoc sp. 'Lobaria pulmonaria (5183) cyanobiont']